MKIPEFLKIGAHTVQVVLKPLDDDNGLTDWASNTIFIDSTLPQTHQEATLIHEIFHILNPTLDDDTLGHALIDSLAEQFYQVLKDNHLIS